MAAARRSLPVAGAVPERRMLAQGVAQGVGPPSRPVVAPAGPPPRRPVVIGVDQLPACLLAAGVDPPPA
eukprot:306124-Chlamydomonas_euryale.AAC.2